MPRGYNSDLVGKKFDRLTVIERVRGTPSGVLWRCRCVCGNEIIKYTGQLSKVRNTGCRACENHSRAAVHVTHGGAAGGKSRLFNIWKQIRRRCEDPKAVGWKYYGSKGVRRCAEWNDFAIFQEWALSHGYTDELSIDRINSDGNYEPSNCEWVTRSENSKRAVVDNREKRHCARIIARLNADFAGLRQTLMVI